ncbi:thiol-disulfide oxidoreductase DCC family protein [Hamadaea tsunoensis]|uniref:thiol-disulfide oxidoreductase DCC family protein n=1 Tax=Hamadaea tsunoensis TaxID=53368 RepID=UPI00040630D7|nr:DCC1-like thiol-disulfide oxidoreductase family protein [Hamadaea tsunoensis]
MTGIFLFDGDCGFCTTCARFLRERIRPEARVRPWQAADLAALGITADECTRAVQWIDGETHLAGPAAMGAVLRTGRPVWRIAGWILQRRWVAAAAWPAYRLVAANRHRLPGGTEACALPHPLTP